jgi:hypothetical protein
MAISCCSSLIIVWLVYHDDCSWLWLCLSWMVPYVLEFYTSLHAHIFQVLIGSSWKQLVSLCIPSCRLFAKQFGCKLIIDLFFCQKVGRYYIHNNPKKHQHSKIVVMPLLRLSYQNFNWVVTWALKQTCPLLLMILIIMISLLHSAAGPIWRILPHHRTSVQKVS